MALFGFEGLRACGSLPESGIGSLLAVRLWGTCAVRLAFW